MGQGRQTSEPRAGLFGIRSLARAVAVLGALVCLVHVGSALALSSTPASGSWVADGPVYAIAHSNGTTYIGGDFSHVGLRTGPGVPFSLANGMPFSTFDQVGGGQVLASVAAPDGSFYIGGDFTTVGGVARTGLAHILSTGQLDPSFNVPLACAAQSTNCSRPAVRALAFDTATATLYLGGTFEKVASTTRNYLAAISVSDGSLLDWNPSPGYYVDALAVVDFELDKTVPVVFVGGEFTTIASATRSSGLAALWGVGAQNETGGAISGTLTSWDPSWGTHAVPRVLLPGGTRTAGGQVGLAVYAGGDLLAANATPPILNAFPFTVGAANRTTNGSTSAYGYWTPGAACGPKPWPGPYCGVDALAISGSTLYVGGSFTSIGQGTAQPRNGLAALPVIDNPLATSATNPATAYAWDPKPDAAVGALAADGQNVYVGGEFTKLGTDEHAGLVAIPVAADAVTPAAPLLLTWDAGVIGPSGPQTLALDHNAGTLYAGGGFSAAEARTRERLAAFGSDGQPTSWAPGADASVRALAVSGNVVYAGGGFTNLIAGGHPPPAPVARAHLGALSAADGAVLPWQADANDWVMSLGVAGQTVYAGGAFTAIGNPSANRNHVAAIGAVGATDAGGHSIAGHVSAWNPGPDGSVRAIAASCGIVYLGGDFQNVGGLGRDGIVALDPTTGVPTAWNPGASSVVYALAPAGDVVYAGGAFTVIGNKIRPGIAALDSATGEATAWNPYPQQEPVVRALALGGDGTVYAGGDFRSIGGQTRHRLAGLDPATGLATAWDPSVDDYVYALAASGDNVWAGGIFGQSGTVMQQGFAAFSGGSDGTGSTTSTCGSPAAPRTAPPPPLAPPPGPSPAPTTSSAPPAQPAVVDTLAPAISVFALTRDRFRVAKASTALAAHRVRVPVGTAFQVDVSETGTAVVTIERCTAKRGCRTRRLAGSLRRALRAGTSRIRFSGRLGTRALAPGRYLATVRVTDAAGNVSRPKRVRFEVVA